MKKQLLLAATFAATVFMANAQIAINFSEDVYKYPSKPDPNTAIEFTSPSQSVNGFTIYNDGSSKFTYDYSSKTVDGVVYTTRAKTGGAGVWNDDNEPLSRIIEFKVSGPGTISGVLSSSNSSDDRVIFLAKGKIATTNGDGGALTDDEIALDPNYITQFNVSASAGWVTYSYNYTGEETTIYLYSKSGGLNIFALSATSGVGEGTDPGTDPTDPVTDNRTWTFSDNAVEETTSNFTYTEAGNELSVIANTKKCLVSVGGEFVEGSDAATTIGYLSLGGSGAAVSIPSCSAGDIIEFIIAPSGDIAAGSAKSRGLQVEGADYFLPIPWTKAVSKKFEHTVIASGDIILSSYNSGLWIFDLSVKTSGTSQIETNDVAKTIIASEYYNISGLKMNEAQPGLNIVKNYYEDGSVKVTKVYIK